MNVVYKKAEGEAEDLARFLDRLALNTRLSAQDRAEAKTRAAALWAVIGTLNSHAKGS